MFLSKKYNHAIEHNTRNMILYYNTIGIFGIKNSFYLYE